MPICPVHQSEMRAGNKGGFYCPKKMPDGTYCVQKSRGATIPPPPAMPHMPETAAATVAQTTPRHLLVLAALDFAGKVYQGTGQDQGALGLAQAALHEFGTELL